MLKWDLCFHLDNRNATTPPTPPSCCHFDTGLHRNIGTQHDAEPETCFRRRYTCRIYLYMNLSLRTVEVSVPESSGSIRVLASLASLSLPLSLSLSLCNLTHVLLLRPYTVMLAWCAVWHHYSFKASSRGVGLPSFLWWLQVRGREGTAVARWRLACGRICLL